MSFALARATVAGAGKRQREGLIRIKIARYEFRHRGIALSTNEGRGRDEAFTPPARIPACAANVPGSSLGFWRRSGDRAAGAATRAGQAQDLGLEIVPAERAGQFPFLGQR